MSFTYAYPRPSLTADPILVTKSKSPQILLIQRKNNPFKDMWAIPGGFLDMDETIKDAAIRELKEETGIDITNLNQLGIYDAVERDPRGRTITVAFYAEIEGQIEAVAQDDAKDARWFAINDLPTLAFDHLNIIQDLQEILK